MPMRLLSSSIMLATFPDCPERVGAGEDAISEVETAVHHDNFKHEASCMQLTRQWGAQESVLIQLDYLQQLIQRDDEHQPDVK